MSKNDIHFGRQGQSDVHQIRFPRGRVRFACGHARPTLFADALKPGKRAKGIPFKAWCVECDDAMAIEKVEQ